ncbi:MULTISPECIES: hypothetical protein [Amycolatopsis]|uniref:Secreted protein n=1 Tax=Amycolatopsis thermalba TaxID=944492 RepID=A0ABY4P4L2_9PSEU|nr:MULTISPECIES: hypothetical protein [Amycolatopsis]OXM73185.1 hypothetical protein CF166_11805 [Amycolatopsis sp. KNN50.9b]UQS27128.1 hypothetical protein L1857_32160 [Amycolatopsis thermalba]
MRKVVARLAAVGAAVAVLLGVLAGTASAVSSTGVAAEPPSETRAVVVGTLSFGLMIAAAGAVFWYTARHRGPQE